jgi:hypothetical protein
LEVAGWPPGPPAGPGALLVTRGSPTDSWAVTNANLTWLMSFADGLADSDFGCRSRPAAPRPPWLAGGACGQLPGSRNWPLGSSVLAARQRCKLSVSVLRRCQPSPATEQWALSSGPCSRPAASAATQLVVQSGSVPLRRPGLRRGVGQFF